MTLGDFEIVPGVVIDANDPLKQCRVKACAPGMFDINTMDKDDLMWISPFAMSGNQSFSTLNVGTKIWILHNVKNYFEYWYIPKFEKGLDFPNVENGDVLMSRSIGGNDIKIYYSDNDGIILSIGNSKVNIDKDGKIMLNSGETAISIDNNFIKIGSNEPEYYAVRAEALMKAISDFCSDLGLIAAKMASNPYTANLAQTMLEASNNLSKGIKQIKSNNVKIS